MDSGNRTPFGKFKQDVQRWVEPGQIADPSILTIALTFRLLYRHMGLRVMAWYRLACWFKLHRIPLYIVTLRWIMFRFGLELWGEIDGGLYIAHPVGTVIGANRIGRNCSVIAAVTIGMRNEHSFPVIGDNVFIGAGARILGDIHVGDGAKVGANAVVIYDVPAGATVVGIPASELRTAASQLTEADAIDQSVVVESA